MGLFDKKKEKIEEVKELKKEIMQKKQEALPMPKPAYDNRDEISDKKLDEESAVIVFKMLVRSLYEVEQQIKTGKVSDIDEARKEKLATQFVLLNKADNLKLMMKPYYEGLQGIGYTEEQLEGLKSEALKGKDTYSYYTI